MNDKTKLNSDEEQTISMTEHLSAMLDDEAGSFEQRRILDELKSSDDLSGKLAHYALIGESMRTAKQGAVADTGFLAGIHEQIDSEEEYHDVQVVTSGASAAKNDSASDKKSWLRPVGGFALAASVAAVSVIGVQNYQKIGQEQGSVTIAAQSKPVIKQSLSALQQQAQQAKIASTDERKLVAKKAIDNTLEKSNNHKEYRQANAHARSFLKRYVDSHMQYASSSTFVPSVRVIAYADYQ